MICLKHSAPIIACAAVLFLNACVDDSSNSDDEGVSADSFDFVGMLTNYADNIILPNYQTVSQSADTLAADSGPLDSYCAAVGTPDEASAQSQAFAAWRQVQAAIQRSETHILGPATDNSDALLNRLNAYNAGELSTCGIDQAVVLSDENITFDITSRTLNQRGISTMEYLLFNEDLTHTCPSQITETANWNARTQLERQQLRCQYALKVAQDIANAASDLVDAWDVNEGNYRGTFINPNNTASSLEALSDALFYLDVDVKDRKLGIPTGINNNGCASVSCPDQVESLYSETSLANIRSNLESFNTMLRGADGLGFDDIITAAGVSDLNTRLLSNIDEAIDLIDNTSTSLREQAALIVSSSDEASCANAFANPFSSSGLSACRLYGVIKRITDDLKVDFVAAVNVDLPDRAQSDND